MVLMTLSELDTYHNSALELILEAKLTYGAKASTAVAQELGLTLVTDSQHMSLATRTSSCIVLASVGTYMGYRLCTRLMGDDFLSTIVYSVRRMVERPQRSLTDGTPQMSPLFRRHPLDSPGVSSFLIFADDEDSSSEDEETADVSTRETTLQYASAQPSPMHRAIAAHHSTARAQGLFDAVRHSTPLRRRREQQIDEMSETTSADMSLTSAQLHLQWDEPLWDDTVEFSRSPDTFSDISALARFSGGVEVNEGGPIDVHDVEERGRTEKNDHVQDNLRAIYDEATDLNTDIAQLMRRSNIQGKELYRSVVMSTTASEIGSIATHRRSRRSMASTTSNVSNFSNMSRLLHPHRYGSNRTGSSGLMQLSGAKISRSSTPVMEDSCYQSTTQSEEVRSPQSPDRQTDTTTMPRPESLKIDPLIDSAISTDNATSDSELPLEERPMGIVRRSDLLCPSQPSFQLDDSEDTPRHVPSTSKSSTNQTSSRSNSRQNCASVASMEWDDPLDGVIMVVEKGERGEEENGEPCSSSSLNQSATDLNMSSSSDPPVTVDWQTLLTAGVSRDLMVYARERYMNNPHAIKMLSSLYAKRRLRRVLHLAQCDGQKTQRDLGVTNVLSAVIHICRCRSLPLMQCTSWSTVETAVNTMWKRCSFLREWNSPDDGGFTDYSGTSKDSDSNSSKRSNSRSNSKKEALTTLKHLWDTQLVQGTSVQPKDDVVSHTAMRLLMLLRAIDMYDEVTSNRSTTHAPFYDQLFARHSLPTIMHQIIGGVVEDLTDAELHLALLADTLRIRVEIYRPESQNPHLVAVYPEKFAHAHTTVPLLQDGALTITPLLHVPQSVE